MSDGAKVAIVLIVGMVLVTIAGVFAMAFGFR